MFANETTGKPFHASTIQQEYLRPAGRQICLGNVWLGTHSATAIEPLWTHRGTAAAHAAREYRMMNVYGGAYRSEQRQAHERVVQMLLPASEEAATGMAASQRNFSEMAQCGVDFR